MKRFHLISMALLLVVSAVACDDAVPGVGDDLGGIWFGSMASDGWGQGANVSVSTPSGELRTITLIAGEVGPAEAPADIGLFVGYDSVGHQVVVRGMSEGGAVSANLISFLDELSGENVAGLAGRLTSGLSAGTLEIYQPAEPSVPVSLEVPAGVPADDSNFGRFEMICGGSPSDCFMEAAIAKGSDIANLISYNYGEGDPVEALVYEGAYQQPVYESPSSLDMLEGTWVNYDSAVGFDVISGSIDGGEEGYCVYGGSLSVIDPTRNVYAMTLVVSNCNDSGTYNGLAVRADDEETGTFLIFQVDNGAGMMLADVLEFQILE